MGLTVSRVLKACLMIVAEHVPNEDPLNESGKALLKQLATLSLDARDKTHNGRIIGQWE